ncbi:hypothetical protein [Ancylobacter radicis]|uniref:Uncharacterized protein n=1 Tax=Ancylobacter radicis TaxID=2836179 RepID=A0ABS5R3A3_9HYPH|nr:hypothetical protein [Ancylobacter radicis]MBS9476130.1 hypothetical protein [Ancylobacter radicis]
MQRFLGARVAIILAVLLVSSLPAAAQTSTSQGNRYMPQRPDSVKPNSQNLMQGPSYWTPQQRRLNVPGATANPSLRRDTGPYPPPPLPTAPPPKKPAS